MEAELLQELGIAGGRPQPPPPPVAEPHSPQTRIALQSLYSSIDDDANRCVLSTRTYRRPARASPTPVLPLNPAPNPQTLVGENAPRMNLLHAVVNL